MTPADLPWVMRRLRTAYDQGRPPVAERLRAQTGDPFKILVATLLSARTRDETTAVVIRGLFAKVRTWMDLETITLAELEQTIHASGFFRQKARHLKALPGVIRDEFDGVIPDTVEALCRLPGVGRKTANLVVATAFGKPAICVDVHVHRISNRLGLVCTRTPAETEMALRKRLPVRDWIAWNPCLVVFGQTRCKPRKPGCAGCPLQARCDRVGVKES